MLQNKKAVIFDLDGTLVDSMWLWKEIDMEYLSRYGITLPEDLQTEIEGKSFTETALYFKERFQISEEIEKIKTDWNEMAWDKYRNKVPMKKGAISFLNYCKEKGLKLGIATSNSAELVRNIAAVHGLHDYFDVILTGCDVQKGKPAPDIYLAVASKLNCNPYECLVFEDIIPGIRAGLDAGMTVCAIDDPYSTHQLAKKKEIAHYFITDYEDILTSLT